MTYVRAWPAPRDPLTQSFIPSRGSVYAPQYPTDAQDWAERHAGVPYAWGGQVTDPPYDSAGFVTSCEYLIPGHPQDRQHQHGDGCDSAECQPCACCTDIGPDCG